MATVPVNPSAAVTAPRVTLIMTVRERYSPTLSTLESLMANTAMPFRLVFADTGLPPWLSEAVAAASRRHCFEVVQFADNMWPQQVRKMLAPGIDTEYVAFLDNDLLFHPGWLEKLVACADETGAGLVGPLYLWGDGIAPPRVHMAGGSLEEISEAAGRVLLERHEGYDADAEAAAATLVRSPCDFLEFHCMLFRTELARQSDMLDPRICCVHEHIDVALTARHQGQTIYLEPAARVLYRAFIPTTLEDLPLMRRRWSRAAVEESIAAFCDKWQVINDDRSFGELRGYVGRISLRNDPIRSGPGPAVPISTAR
jgi:GT2 family glycosyltransferase